MFNLFSQENMYDEAATQEDMTGERAAAEAKWQERRQKIRGRAEERNGTTTVYRRDTSRIQERFHREIG